MQQLGQSPFRPTAPWQLPVELRKTAANRIVGTCQLIAAPDEGVVQQRSEGGLHRWNRKPGPPGRKAWTGDGLTGKDSLSNDRSISQALSRCNRSAAASSVCSRL